MTYLHWLYEILRNIYAYSVYVVCNVSFNVKKISYIIKIKGIKLYIHNPYMQEHLQTFIVKDSSRWTLMMIPGRQFYSGYTNNLSQLHYIFCKHGIPQRFIMAWWNFTSTGNKAVNDVEVSKCTR